MTDRHAIGMMERHARLSEFIQVRRPVGLTSVALQHFLTNIISEDKQDIGFLVFGGSRRIEAAPKKDGDDCEVLHR